MPFIPEIARTKKKAIDNILLTYKRNVDDSIRYIIRNDVDDVKVLIKRYNEYDYLPYREIGLKALGKLPNLNTITKDDKVNVELEDRTINPDEFRFPHKRKQRSSPKKLTQNQIHENITKFLNGFEIDSSEESEAKSTESEDESIPDSIESESTGLERMDEAQHPGENQDNVQTNS